MKYPPFLLIALMSCSAPASPPVAPGPVDAVPATRVYTEARYAMDLLENDLLGVLSFEAGGQRFCMDNGVVRMGANGADTPVNTSGGGHASAAADRIIFRSTTTIADTVQTAEITYELQGDPARGKTSDGRPLYVLVRRTRVLNPATNEYIDIPRDSKGLGVNDTEACAFVTSFNFEYQKADKTFAQLDPSLFRSDVPAGGENDALGNGRGANDTGATKVRIPTIRLTLNIVDAAGEAQRRTLQKTFWIPLG